MKTAPLKRNAYLPELLGRDAPPEAFVATGPSGNVAMAALGSDATVVETAPLLLLLPAQERRAARLNGAAAVPEDTTHRRTIFQPRASDLHAARAMCTREWTGLCGNGAAV